METENSGTKEQPDASGGNQRLQRSALLSLPHELQIHICSYLTFRDLGCLRETSHYYESLITLNFLRLCFSSAVLDHKLLRICGRCFWNSPPPETLLWTEPEAMNERLRARCVSCAGKEGIFYPPSRILYVLDPFNAIRDWPSHICRWCGRPTRIAATFHARCRRKYRAFLIVYYVLLVARSLFTLASLSLALWYYHSEAIILAPVVFIFVLLGILLLFTIFRRHLTRTYHITGVLEVLLLCAFIPPTCFFALHLDEQIKGAPQGMTKICLIIYAVNMAIRFISILGNIVLYFEYDTTMSSTPHSSRERKLVNSFMLGLVCWTSPKSLLNRYIGRWNASGEKSFYRNMKESWAGFKGHETIAY
ncbi:Fc.00g079900.m01.CDS01 [Cosmosporella sp. VM-42]